ncbi:MAG: tetratricopeptide repeat protein [Pseudomonadota bacterium]
MELSTGFLIYAGVFRLAVIAVGVVAIVLGYRLFVRASIVKGRTEAGLEIAKFKLNLKNAAPGTCFAAFGAGIVLAMLIEGSPSLTMETAQGVAANEQARAAQTIRLKGDGQAQLPADLAQHLGATAGQVRDGDLSGAMASYSALLRTPGLSAAEAGLALEPMARIALQREDMAQAETLARLAVQFTDGAPQPLDTLARILIARGEPAEAVALAKRAAASSPDEASYLHTLARGLAQTGESREAESVLEQAIRLDPVYQAERERLAEGAQ